MEQDGTKRLTHEEFVRIAILRLRDLSKSRGIHAVYSGFNSAFREYFGQDPVELVRDLARQGKLEIAPRKGGVMIYLPGEAPKSASTQGKEALSKILQNKKTSTEHVFEKVVDELIPGRRDENLKTSEGD
jgi:hypothetical protein